MVKGLTIRLDIALCGDVSIGIVSIKIRLKYMEKEWKMYELEKVADVALDGKAAEEILKEFDERLRVWDLKMPDVKPIVQDFGLGDFDTVGLIEYWIANNPEAGYCGKYLFVFDGQSCPKHRHKHKHETFCVVKGKVRMEYDGATIEMKEGDVLPVEQWKYHSFTGIGPALLLEVSQPCELDDNYFENQDIPIGGNHRTG